MFRISRADINKIMRSEAGFFGCGAIAVVVVGLSILLLIDWKLAATFGLAVLGILGLAAVIWAGRYLYRLATRTGGE